MSPGSMRQNVLHFEQKRDPKSVVKKTFIMAVPIKINISYMGPEEIKNRQSKNLLKLRMLGLVGLMVNLRSRGTLQIFHQSTPTLSSKLLCKS